MKADGQGYKIRYYFYIINGNLYGGVINVYEVNIL